ncbi:ABC transporter permease [Mucilaginibacter mali]|uniref:ABC transporter permease n=1 Tax=Mucilaginibacter mali TaxID=2740462 RepID=A0A7D4TUP8_9SPHI|nr:ABC transporter permease [Mucilaginibacter mali]QKJ29855.1 ABC transporter permease [Mucilaginibacter mali]
MLKNYLKIAFRTLLRDRSFSVLNLFGLAIGLASVIMIMAYIRYELSYDKGYSNYPQVYRLLQVDKPGSVSPLRVNVNMHMADVLQKEFPAIVASTPLGCSTMQFKYHNDIVKVTTIDAKADFFKIFNYQFLSGDPKTALQQPGSLVLSQTVAKQYFNGINCIGNTITDNYGNIRHVTGVVKDMPQNTHLRADVVISDDNPDQEVFNMESYTSMPQYVLLNKNTNAAQLEQQFKSIYKKYKFPEGTGVRLQPVTDIHLRSHYFSEISVNSDIKYIYIFASIALLILFIACINYINLTTARSLQRAREIGLRKVLGALRKQLIVQFLTESFLFFLISTILAIVIAYSLWPVFSAKITAYQQVPLFDIAGMLGIALIFAVGGLLSGAYPAFFLSALQPVKVLKGLSKFGINISLRKALVVLQFSISGVMIIATLIVNRQLSYISNARLGFNKDNLIDVPFFIRKSQVTAFKRELLKNKDIKAVSVASWRMGQDYGMWNNYKDRTDTTKDIRYNFTYADLNFVNTMGIRILEGRNFSRAYGRDMLSPDSAWRLSKKMGDDERAAFQASFPIMLNQEAVNALGLKNPVGKVLTKPIKGTVIAVVENFNGLSLHQKIGPVIIKSDPECEQGDMYIRVSSANISASISYIESRWKKFYPDKRFEFAFTDDKLQQLYTADQRLGSLFNIFSSLAIIIACLGLFGLISLTVQNRVKEIGIRKVLGASVLDIANLVSMDFIKLVVISFVIASPIGWYFMNKWLQDFAYRTSIDWWVFALACGITLFIAVATLSIRSVKAAITNPVNSLRNE